MHTLDHYTTQFTPYLHAFSHALASMGLGMAGEVAYDDDFYTFQRDSV